MNRLFSLFIAVGISFSSIVSVLAAEIVTVDNFFRADSDVIFGRYVKQGAFGKFLHIRQVLSS